MVGETAVRLTEAVKRRKEDAKTWVVERCSVRQASALTAGWFGVLGTSTTAAAQSVGEVGGAMCGSGLGDLVGYGFIAAALYFLVKGAFKAMSALDKMQSSSSSTTREGSSELWDAGSTGAAAVFPSVLAVIFELAGINTVSCLAPQDWSLLGAIVVHIPV